MVTMLRGGAVWGAAPGGFCRVMWGFGWVWGDTALGSGGVIGWGWGGVGFVGV